jgi:hypothetical protein
VAEVEVPQHQREHQHDDAGAAQHEERDGGRFHVSSSAAVRVGRAHSVTAGPADDQDE